MNDHHCFAKTLHHVLKAAGKDTETCQVADKNIETKHLHVPPNISTNSDPAMARNGTLASVATALANSVLPHPGGPSNKAP
jgi:hypothetical protein